MKDVILIRNALIGGKRHLAGAVVSVEDDFAKHLASLDIAFIPQSEKVEEEKPVRVARRRTTRKKVSE